MAQSPDSSGFRRHGEKPLWENWGIGGGQTRTQADAEANKGFDVVGNSGGIHGPPSRILQAPGYVALVMGKESDGDSYEGDEYRVIPLDRRTTLGPKVKQWHGFSRGHWEGNTLVVETTNITFGGPIIHIYGSSYPGTGEALKVTERYTRVNADTLEYRATIEDPAVYVRPYTVLHELTRQDQYVAPPEMCHENNRDLGAMLAHARGDEEAAIAYVEEATEDRQQRFRDKKAEWAASGKR